MFIENEIASAFLYSVDRANDKILNTKYVFHFCKNLEMFILYVYLRLLLCRFLVSVYIIMSPRTWR